MKATLQTLLTPLALGALILGTAQAQETTLPITETPLTLDYWVPMNSNATVVMKSYAEIHAYKELFKRTGITLSFIQPPSGDATQQSLNLLVVSGDYPDIVEVSWLGAYPGGPAKALSDGVIIPLNDLVEEHAPNLTALLEANPDVRREITTADGTLYAFPFLRLDKKIRVFLGPIVRQDWLDKLGLETPTDIQSWHDTLTAFKEQDPNGNGEADEIPWGFSGAGFNDGNGALLAAFGSGFGLLQSYYRVDDEVHYSPFDPSFKDFLTTMNAWYNEGLIDPDYLIANADEFDSQVLNDKVGATIGYGGSTVARINTLAEESDPDLALVGAPFPADDSGTAYNPVTDAGRAFALGLGAAITRSNENVVESVKLLDYAYGDEGSLLMNFGPDGYKMVDGQPTWADKVEANGSLSFSQVSTEYGRGGFDGPFIQNPGVIDASPEQQTAIDAWSQASVERILPPLSPADKDVQSFTSIMSEAETYVNEMTANFISGREPLENFEQFHSTLEQMGVGEAIAIMQASLDAYNQK